MPELTVRLIKIINLSSDSRRDKADPYVKFELEQNNIFLDKDFGNMVSTSKTDNCSPVFSEKFVFHDLPGLDNMELKIKVMDRDPGLEDDQLGHCTIKLEDLNLEAIPTRIRRKVDDNWFGTDAYIFLALSYGEKVLDDDAKGLSHVGMAAYEALRTKHGEYHHTLWNITQGKVVGKLHQTPIEAFPGPPDGHEDGHDDWFPEIMGEILSRTQVWADVVSLSPPDGKFMTAFQNALVTIAENAAEREKPVVIRMLFGNLPGLPVNCDAVREELTKDLPEDANIHLWIGAWRRGASWNHAKIIAVDGKYLHTGGHNMWDAHYLLHDPVHDLSLEMAGEVAYDGHLFANRQWNFIETKQEQFWGNLFSKMPDSLPTILPIRANVSEWPPGNASEHAPEFRTKWVRSVAEADGPVENCVPVITMGRYGNLVERDRPADDAFLAMLGSAKKIIHLALQDLGPVCIPGTKIALPGTSWPDNYLTVVAKALWERGVDVEIIVSNPGSIPGGLTPLEAAYGNGWSCVDVAAEIIKRIKRDYPDAECDDLRAKVNDNLRIAYLREGRGNAWADGQSMGMHAKHFIVDDITTYIGSHNLYVCDLAEWGVVIDDAEQTQKIMEEYWNPMWECSHTGEDVDVDAVMDSLDIDRDGGDASELDDDMKQQMLKAETANFGYSSSGHYDTEE